jgi:hypothetical protein
MRSRVVTTLNRAIMVHTTNPSAIPMTEQRSDEGQHELDLGQAVGVEHLADG